MTLLDPGMKQKIGIGLQDELTEFRRITQRHESEQVSFSQQENDTTRLVLEESYEENTYDHQRVAKLSTSVQEIANLFQEVSQLVIVQGELVDRIDVHVENALNHVQQGTQELRKADNASKKSKTLYIICCLLLIVIILIVAIVAKNNK
jgi:t-SNARE complex subunit (syntaxin)